MKAFDLETTGIDVLTARIVTASVIDLDASTRGKVNHDWLANPGVPIPETATAVHGITDEKAAAEGRPAREVVMEINEHMERAHRDGTPIVGFNLAYDMSVLRAESIRHELEPPKTPLVIDAHVLDKAMDKYRRGGRKLTDVAALYGIDLKDAHSADADSYASALVAYRMALKYPEQLQIPLEELHEKQRQWFAESAISFQKYKRERADPNICIPPQWPVRTAEDDPWSVHCNPRWSAGRCASPAISSPRTTKP